MQTTLTHGRIPLTPSLHIAHVIPAEAGIQRGRASNPKTNCADIIQPTDD